MRYTRTQTRALSIGQVKLGHGAPVAVQSMTNTDTRDVEATLAQIEELAAAGCELVRCAVLDQQAARSFKSLSLNSPVPLVADIHFDADLAVLAVESGAQALRINPGNIGGDRALDKVVAAAKAHQTPIRVGANSGSLPKDILQEEGGPTPLALVRSALRHVDLLRQKGFEDIKVSLKSSSVLTTIAAVKLFAQQSDLPQHLGITEAGGILAGAVKSGLGIGALLLEGLGDTIRVSLTAPPLKEVQAAWHLLNACGLRRRGVEVISCPTCGRTEINLIRLAEEVENALSHIARPLTVAVMGCVVNGPGEAGHADIGIAGGRGQGVVFVKGKIKRKVAEDQLLPALLEEIANLQLLSV